ncbi:hypothetical protein [Runella sp.]|jgi:hypothetical protein|uniref:hypothetical protein n=1 Tax=Runella sp. TaxID=1960881 RepID=UPI002618206C|nr:hypothetical protein [Runella sp.]
MNALSLFFDRIANWKVLLLIIAIYISFPAYFLKDAETRINILAGKTLGPIDLTMGFTPERTLQMVAEYGDEARAYYATVESTIDLVYPITYAFLFGVILTLVYRKKRYKPFPYVNILPFVALIFDYLENITIVTMLKSYPDQSIVVASLCEFFKLGKWLTFAITIVLIIYGLLKMVPKMKKA